MKRKETNLEVLEVEAEELELPLEKKIEKALIKENITDKVIEELKNRYSGLKLKAIDDKESYLQIKEAKKNVRAIGIITEKLCKHGREDAVKEQRLWLAKEKEILSKIDEVQEPLENEIKKFEDEVERLENEEKERKEKVFQERQSTLIKYGAQYNNGSFELNHISYQIDNIKEADNEIWESIILPKFYVEFEKLEAEKVRIEKEREAAALKLKQEQEELNRQREEMETMKRELAAEQLRMQKIKDEAERVKNMLELEAKNKKAQQEEKIWRERLSQLKDVSWNGEAALYWSEVVLTISELINISDESFVVVRDAHNKSVEQRQKQEEEKRIADAEAQRQKDIEAALQKERERVAKEKEDAELKTQQDKIRKEEELAQAGDRVKWADVLRQINELAIPEMKSPTYRKKIQILKEKISEIKEL